MLRLQALDWVYTNDLDAPPDRFSVTFLNSGTLATVPGEDIPSLGMEHVEIFGIIDDSEFRVCEGVVREWGIAEGPDETVLTAGGIGLKADLIDWKPTVPKTYRGMELLSAATAPVPAGAVHTAQLHSDSVGNPVKAAFFETFQSVAADVVRSVGLEPSFDCADYWLGSEIVWEVDRSANDIIAQLATPFNATERFKLDLHLESNTARFVERERTVPATVTLPVTWIARRQARKSKPKPVNDVQVLGASFTYPEPPTSETRIEWPDPDREPRQETKETIFYEDYYGSPIEVARLVESRWFDKDGNELYHSSTKTHSLTIYRAPDGPNKGQIVTPGTGSPVRVEHVENTILGRNGPNGEVTKRQRTTFVEDHSYVYLWNPNSKVWNGIGTNNIFQDTEEVTEEWEYGTDGNVTHEKVTTRRAEEPRYAPSSKAGSAAAMTGTSGVVIEPWGVTPSSASTAVAGLFPGDVPTGLVKAEEMEMTYWWSGRQRWRTVVQRIFDKDKPDQPQFERSYDEIATGKQPVPPSSSSVSSLAFRTAPGQIKSGPDHSQMKLTFPTLGTPEDAAYFRNKIKQEREKYRYAVEFGGPPDLNPQAGLKLQITSAPTRWQTDTFLVVSKTLRHDADAMEMDLRGLAWLDN